jgi:hypothetical protein
MNTYDALKSGPRQAMLIPRMNLTSPNEFAVRSRKP